MAAAGRAHGPQARIRAVVCARGRPIRSPAIASRHQIERGWVVGWYWKPQVPACARLASAKRQKHAPTPCREASPSPPSPPRIVVSIQTLSLRSPEGDVAAWVWDLPVPHTS
ncbi:hypothetical protein GGTG_06886 [Gaeumannomyces tritici R3-111a-1]|uniref:Uncharacterized protein n=1 Tax=Gaeumannomyces tritici (strain R3-111a-1) TaxID=644352 RepID=J3P039_GAET3|nr:hypothetical protein GGTG_06886 [Gaeumannomyces tritici R3-111a-1]EJT76972.1 hypothetical protein GGTG_06886 [Gaeumannomyces tritici R3-111a-1]